MKKVLLFIGLINLHLSIRSQDNNFNYSSTLIADSLKKDANIVVRLDEGILTILSPSKYNYKVHEVYTILNAEGAYRLRHRLYSDKFRSVDNVNVRIYNQLGILTKKHSKKEYTVSAAYDGISLATDDKVMELAMIAPSYPCTIDIEYEQNIHAYIDLPDWYLNTHNTSTEIFKYTVVVPVELDIRHRCVNLALVPSVHAEGNKKIYKWEAKNVTAKRFEDHSYAVGYYYPRIEVAPNRFEYDNYSGSLSSWSDFGKWKYSLYQEKSPFSASRKRQIQSLVEGKTSMQDKVAVLYDYLKSQMRYVSLQFGIGGYKPFGVRFVDEKKYGDCKALTNYMRYLLDAVDIKSYPALINAGYDSEPIDPVFPKNTFNHVILCVPNNKDTIWLECTSKDSKAGFLGSFTEERLALLLTENGGSLVRTPPGKYENNLFSGNTEIFINDEGGAKTATRIYTTGDIGHEFGQIKKLQPDDKKEALINYMNYKSGEVFEMLDAEDSAFGLIVKINSEFTKLYAFKAGSKFFFHQKLNKNFYEELKDGKRTFEYLFEYPYKKTDTTIFYLPKNWVVDELPVQKEITNDLASYKKDIFSDPSGRIKITTSLVLKKRIIPADAYQKLYRFFAEVKENEEQNIVLRKL